MIRDNSILINEYWFTKALPCLSPLEWQCFSLFLYKQNLSASSIEDILENDVNKTLTSLEKKGLLVIDGNAFRIQFDEKLHVLKPKKVKQSKAVFELEDSSVEANIPENWTYFLPSLKLNQEEREIFWLVFEAAKYDVLNPYNYILNVDEWKKDAKTAWRISGGDMQVIVDAINQLLSIGYTVNSPKSLLKTILRVKNKKEDKNISSVGGFFK